MLLLHSFKQLQGRLSSFPMCQIISETVYFQHASQLKQYVLSFLREFPKFSVPFLLGLTALSQESKEVFCYLAF